MIGYWLLQALQNALPGRQFFFQAEDGIRYYKLTGVQTCALPIGRGAAAASSPGPLFEHLLGLLTRLGERQPTVLVLEDMHWADASTMALIAFLGRNLREARVVLVLTYRADELHRRHPLRPLLTDLERDPLVERVRLSGLSRAEPAELVT